MTWLVVFVFMLLFVAVMAIGVMNGRKPLSGSCGGVAIEGHEEKCSYCGGDTSKCKRDKEKAAH